MAEKDEKDQPGDGGTAKGRATAAKATAADPAAAAGSQEYKPEVGSNTAEVADPDHPQTDQSLAADQRERFLAVRESDHVSAKDAAIEADGRVAELTRELAAATAKAGAGQVANVPADQLLNVQNQVHQEGALVETPPQPSPPPFPAGAEDSMDLSPRGMREPSVAAEAFGDTDQTVHPQSRVDDPRIPL